MGNRSTISSIDYSYQRFGFAKIYLWPVRINFVILKGRLFILAIVFSLISIQLQAQNAIETDPGVKVIGLSDGEKIMLRWGLNDYLAWKHTNSSGFGIERRTIVRDGDLLDPPEVTQMTMLPIMPRPLAEWESFAEDDIYVEVAAQAIYGESFEVTYGDNSPIGQIINQVRENEQRFQLALFAADQSPQTAKLSGLYFEDKEVVRGERYLYRVYSLVSPQLMEIDTGFVLLGLENILPSLAPYNLTAQFGDMAVALQWRTEFLDRYYSGFHVERSGNSLDFNRITETPIAIFEKNGKAQWVDSLPDNKTQYHYRVKAISPFGMLSIPSDTVSGHGIVPFTDYPNNLKSEIINNDRVQLEWEFNDNPQLSRFAVLRAGKASGSYDTLESKLQKTENTYLDPNPLGTGYYKVAAFSADGQRTSSFPVLVQLEDTIPPAPPIELNGEIDTTGTVRLLWKPNSESDLLGYRVFRSLRREGEFVQITAAATEDVGYSDTINIKTLNERIYYKVQSVDKRYNPSELSDILTIELPDIIPPASPVFKNIVSEADGIRIDWIPSPSDDVVSQLLYRRKSNETTWALQLAVEGNTDTTFYDKDLLIGDRTAYTLIAVDEAGLESPPVKPITGSRIDNGERPAIENVFVRHDQNTSETRLTWEYDLDGVLKYQVYRAQDEGPVTLIGHSEEFEFIDSVGDNPGSYRYGLQAVFRNGAISIMSDLIEIER